MMEQRGAVTSSVPIAWVGFLVVLGGLLWWMHRSPPLDGSVAASVDGVFVADGIVPSRLGSPDGARYWSSWQDDNATTGQLTLGPFPAPRTLGFYAAGYLQAAGNRLWFENRDTGELWEPALESPGEAWSPIAVEMPPGWRGQPMVIHAIDDARGLFGWLALAEPFISPRPANSWYGASRKLGVFLFLGLVLGLAAAGAASVIRCLGFKYEPAVLLLSCALLALSGYFIFWITWLHATLGAVVGWLELLAAGAFAFGRSNGNSLVWRQRDWRIPALLMVGLGLVYLASLLMFATERPMSALAEVRFADRLPEDNLLPQRFAERLAQDLSPKHLVGGWRSSDRPPMQAGWVLLLMRPARALGVDYDTVGQCAGIWAQLLWIPGVWLWLRALKTSPGAASWIIVGLLPTGFLFLNATFVWPKLFAAALMLGAFVFWFVIQDAVVPRTLRIALGGGLAGLAWLAHGGVAFGLVALVPFVVWSCRSWTRVRPWLGAGACFVTLALPWVAYQQWYEPPGNQLVRWHLAGEQTAEKRGTWESLADAYGRITFDEWGQSRRANTRMLFMGEWRSLWAFDFSNPEARRNGESFIFSTLGWWNVGWLPWLAILGRRVLRRSWIDEWSGAFSLSIGWVFLTLAVWVGLMFVGGTTLVHQGSYTTQLVLLPALALTLWRVRSWLFFAAAGAQVAGFVFIWLRRPGHWPAAAIQIDAVVVGVLAAVFCVVVAVRASALDRSEWRVRTKG